jgi:hypothetical protein
MMEAVIQKKTYQWESIYASSDSIIRINSCEDNNDESDGEECFGKSFYKRILLLFIKQVKGQYYLAVLSTLGGAYHLCKRPAKAYQIARMMEVVGSALGALPIIVQSKVFQAVNLKILGQDKKSRKLLTASKELCSQISHVKTTHLLSAHIEWMKKNQL